MGRYAERVILFIVKSRVSFVADDFWKRISHLKKLWIVGDSGQRDVECCIDYEQPDDDAEAEGKDDDQERYQNGHHHQCEQG